MAESVDALVSNTSGATRAGSTPALGTVENANIVYITLLAFFFFQNSPHFPHLFENKCFFTTPPHIFFVGCGCVHLFFCAGAGAVFNLFKCSVFFVCEHLERLNTLNTLNTLNILNKKRRCQPSRPATPMLSKFNIAI